MTSNSDSDTSTGSSPYESDNEIRCCKARRDSLSGDDTADCYDYEAANEAPLPETEETVTHSLADADEKDVSDDWLYPPAMRMHLRQNMPNIYNQIRSQGSIAFAAPSIMKVICQGTCHTPRGIIVDVCCISPKQPMRVLTFTSEQDHDCKYVRYNSRLTSMITSHIEKDLGQLLNAVYGVIRKEVQSSDDTFYKKINSLENTAWRTCLPRALYMDDEKYGKMILSLQQLFPEFSSEQQYREEILDTDKNTDKSHFADETTHHDDVKKYIEKFVDLEQENRLLLEKEEWEDAQKQNKIPVWGPRRKLLWTDDELLRMKDLVQQERTDSEQKTISLKILIFGPTGHGKSALCNGFRSAILGEEVPSTYHAVGCVDESLSKSFQGAQYGKHWIIDMTGVYESKLIDSIDIEKIVAGKVPFYAELTDRLEVKDQKNVKIPASGKNDVSCVVIVLKYGEELGTELRRILETVLLLGGKGVVSYHLVLTHLDKCDSMFRNTNNLPLMYQSAKVQKAVREMSQETGIPPYAISFVKNYEFEKQTDNNTSLHHLRALESILLTGLQQEEKKIQQKRLRELYDETEVQETMITDTDKNKCGLPKLENNILMIMGLFLLGILVANTLLYGLFIY